MADNEELSDELRESIEMLKELDRQGKLSTSEIAKLGKEVSKLDKAAASAGRGVANLGNAAMQFGSAMVKGGDEFGTLKSVVETTGNVMSELAGAVPFVGGALKALGKAATAAAGMAIDRLQVSFTAFQELGQAGLIGAEGMSGLRKQMVMAQVPMEKFSKMMGSASEDLAFISGSALRGGRDFADAIATMNYDSNQYGIQLRRLGMSIEEIGETVVDYSKTYQLMGFRHTGTTQELAAATAKYGYELDKIAKITGQQRKEVQKNREQMMNNTRFAAWQMQQEGKIGKERTLAIADLIGGIRNLSPMMAEGMQDLFASGGIATTEAGRRLIQQGMGPTVENIKRQMMAGTMSHEEARKEMFRAALQNRDKFRDLSAIVGDFGAGIPFEEMRKMAAAAGMSKDQIKDLEKAQKGQKSGQDKMTDSLVKMSKTMDKAQTMFDDMLLSGGLAVKMVDFFVEGIMAAAKILYKVSGKDEKEMQSIVKARDDAVRAHRLGIKGNINKDLTTGMHRYEVDTKQLTEERMKKTDLENRKAALIAKQQKGEKLTTLEKRELEEIDAQIKRAEDRITFMSQHRMAMGQNTATLQADFLKTGSRAGDTGLYSWRVNSTMDKRIANFLISKGWTEERLRNMTVNEYQIIKSRIEAWEKEHGKKLIVEQYDRSTGKYGVGMRKGADVDISHANISKGAELRERYLARKKDFDETYKRLAADGDISEADARILREKESAMQNVATTMSKLGYKLDELIGVQKRQTTAIKVGPVN